MDIPSSLKLMGHTVTVEVIPPIRWKQKDAIGLFFPQKMLIQVKKGRKTQTEQAYMHELMHAVLYVMNDPRYEDEQFVDTSSGLLHQAITTGRYK